MKPVRRRVAFFLSIAAAACGGAHLSGARVGAGPATAVANITSSGVVLDGPRLPQTLYAYSDQSSPLPQSFLRGGRGRGGPNAPPPPPRDGNPPPPPPFARGGRGGPGGPGGPAIGADNTPADNAITDAGATLGRVLFYDRKLSANNTVSCGSCHVQSAGFADTARYSVGLYGKTTNRHAMALANARFYRNGRYFWDERAASLEAQVLQPIQNEVEMGMRLSDLAPKLQTVSYYPALFQAAFGSTDITNDRISRALAQFVRSLVSSGSRFDSAFARQGPPDFSVLTQQERDGQRIFAGRGQCQACHTTNAMIMDRAHNTGLDRQETDAGAGGGRFKSPSLRNVAVRAPYMHDGRFATLDEVVAFYDHDVQDNPQLDPRMRGRGGAGPRRLNLSSDEHAALVAYLKTLTDSSFLTAAKFSDPFIGSR